VLNARESEAKPNDARERCFGGVFIKKKEFLLELFCTINKTPPPKQRTHARFFS
jgi:hypothetical protein